MTVEKPGGLRHGGRGRSPREEKGFVEYVGTGIKGCRWVVSFQLSSLQEGGPFVREDVDCCDHSEKFDVATREGFRLLRLGLSQKMHSLDEEEFSWLRRRLSQMIDSLDRAECLFFEE